MSDWETLTVEIVGQNVEVVNVGGNLHNVEMLQVLV
jgi:hypothetical protein